MRDYRVAKAGQDDISTIERIARVTWPVTFGEILSGEQIDYMLDRMYSPDSLLGQMENGHVFHLLLADTSPATSAYTRQQVDRYRPVGYVSHELDYLPGTTKIHKIYLLPETQGRGFGRALIEYVERLALREGQQRLRLDVNHQNAALGFYERLGFEKLDRYDTDIGNGYLMQDWRLEKSL